MKWVFLFLALMVSTTGTAQLEVQPYASGFSSPVDIVSAFDGSGRLFVVERGGVIKIITDSAQVNSTPFLDISSKVTSGGEQGLLGLAFHPSYPSDGRFFVNYTDDSEGNTVIEQYSVSGNPDIADPSGTILLTIDQPEDNHNGGDLEFGPDGYLYIASGDGGGGGDPGNNGQDPTTLLGALLRIDVNSSSGVNNYGIPPDNPFLGDPNGADEVFSYGLRNPWRFSFDPLTGSLWIADVGQNAWEEVNNISVGGANGANFGWNLCEGNHPYGGSGADCSDYVVPVHEYDHGEGQSITGGYVLSGPNYKDFTGQYVFADYVSGTMWALSGGTATEITNLSNPSTFGRGEDGTVYVASLFQGTVQRIIEEGAFPVELYSFNALPAEEGVQLQWETANEINLSHFDVERSNNAADFVSIGLVSADGNEPSDSTTYQFLDKIRANGNFYYRLKMVDLDGSFTYSTIRTVKLTRPPALSILPNPARSSIEISFPDDSPAEGFLHIYDIKGNILVDKKVTEGDGEKIILEIPHLEPGIYIINYINEYKIETRRFVVN